MATNILFRGNGDNREYPVPAGTKSGTALLIAGKPAMTLTARGDSTETVSAAPGTLTRPNGGIGNKSDSATVAFDGVAIWPVVGATASTAKGTPVYIDSDGKLTLTDTGNTKFGVVYDNKPSAAATAVEVGA